MSYQALARKWRPQFFRDIIGQDTLVRTLQNAIEQQRIHHAYLFSGVRGIGKTTTARIFAKAINCLKGPAAEPCNECVVCSEITEGIDLDVREIDAATYTGVDNVRELRDVTQFQPARDRRRVFIIDEAHMLSNAAWNALLKILEEPPPHMLFMFATTEMHKVPATILSRVQTFVLRKITQKEVAARLAEICNAEGIDADPAALELIARRGEGSVRDSLSLLDQIVAFSGRSFGASDVVAILGLSEANFFSQISAAIRDGDPAAVLNALGEAADAGRDFKLLFRDFMTFLRNLLLVTSGAGATLMTGDPEEQDVVRRVASDFEYSEVLRVLNLLLKDDETVSRAEHQRLAVEVALLKAATLPRLRAVEDAIKGGGAVTTAAKTAPAVKRPAVEPARRSAPAEAPASREPAPDADLVSAVKALRRLTGNYLEQARNCKIDGNSITFEYDSNQEFAVDYLSDSEQLTFVGQVATELYKRPMTIQLTSAGAATSAGGTAKGELPVSGDPVIRAFAKHLGGEVVPPRGGSRSRE
jgi:DNA polymerase-3 subunit gamma/tau